MKERAVLSQIEEKYTANLDKDDDTARANEEKQEKEKVAKALNGQRYPMPLS